MTFIPTDKHETNPMFLDIWWEKDTETNLCLVINKESRIAITKAAFNKKKTLFTSKLDLNLRKKLVKSYVWSMAVYGAESWMLRATDQKRLESLKCGAAEGWRRSVGPIMWEMKECYSQWAEEYPTWNKKTEG